MQPHIIAKALREQRGLSQRQVGEALGIHFATVNKLESGKLRLSADRLIKLADLFGVPLSHFNDDTGASVTPSRSVGEIIRLLRRTDLPADIRCAAAAEQLTQLTGNSG